jgi:hypothetical protein
MFLLAEMDLVVLWSGGNGVRRARTKGEKHGEREGVLGREEEGIIFEILVATYSF